MRHDVRRPSHSRDWEGGLSARPLRKGANEKEKRESRFARPLRKEDTQSKLARPLRKEGGQGVRFGILGHRQHGLQTLAA